VRPSSRSVQRRDTRRVATAAELQAAGLYDPGAPDADDRLAALQVLLDLGASIEELVATPDFGFLAGRLVNGLRPTTTRRQLAERTGMSLDLIDRIYLAVGLPDPGPDVLSATEADVTVLETFAAGSAIFGAEPAFQLARVIGNSTARMADAIVSSFVATVGGPLGAEDPTGLAVVQANLELSALQPSLLSVVELLLRRHLVNLARPQSEATAAGYESRDLVVGFVDLVGSTELAVRLSTAELGAALSRFEGTASDLVVRHGGRVVKLIGDEILFSTPDGPTGVRLAVALVDALAADPVVPHVRAGLAGGPVLTRDGDCFGPVVNLAARIVGAAASDEVLVDTVVGTAAAADGWTVEPLGARELKGFANPVPLLRIAGPSPA
jgi:adenylate cyclase